MPRRKDVLSSLKSLLHSFRPAYRRYVLFTNDLAGHFNNNTQSCFALDVQSNKPLHILDSASMQCVFLEALVWV